MRAPRTALALLAVLASASAAHGADLTVITEDSGAIVGTVHVAAAPDVARARVTDPFWVARVSNTGTSATAAGQDGDCALIDYTSDHTIASIEFRVRQCLTTDGSAAVLVEPSAFSMYAASWAVAPEGDGSLLRYRLELVSTLPVPGAIIRSSGRRSVTKMLTSIEAALANE